MKQKWLFFLLVLALAACSTSKQGCPGANTQGPKYKSSKFDWYKG